MPGAPGPIKEHEWLHRLAGEWETGLEVFAAPGQPLLKVKGTETTRGIGQCWILIERERETKPPAMPFARVLTLGYDLARKAYVGTSVDSTSTHIGRSEGERDAAGKTLTQVGEMPIPTTAHR